MMKNMKQFWSPICCWWDRSTGWDHFEAAGNDQTQTTDSARYSAQIIIIIIRIIIIILMTVMMMIMIIIITIIMIIL